MLNTVWRCSRLVLAMQRLWTSWGRLMCSFGFPQGTDSGGELHAESLLLKVDRETAMWLQLEPAQVLWEVLQFLCFSQIESGAWGFLSPHQAVIGSCCLVRNTTLTKAVLSKKGQMSTMHSAVSPYLQVHRPWGGNGKHSETLHKVMIFSCSMRHATII